MDQERTMYKYPIPTDTQDTFFVYALDASIKGLVSGRDYYSQRISVNHGDFIARAWSGAATILSLSDGQIQIYGRGNDKWWDGPTEVYSQSTLALTGTQCAAVFPERSYRESDLIQMDLLDTLIASPVNTSQVVFYGVRRLKTSEPVSDPAPSLGPYSEEVFDIPYTFTMSSLYSAAAPNILSQPNTQQQIYIRDYDFELRQISAVGIYADGSSAGSPFAIWLYDSNMVQRSNVPIQAAFLCQNRVLQPLSTQVWPCPPIMYRINSYITFDIYSMIPPATDPALLPVTIKMLFRGVRRFPCR